MNRKYVTFTGMPGAARYFFEYNKIEL